MGCVEDFLPCSALCFSKSHESCRRLLTLECFWVFQEPWVVSQTFYFGVLMTSQRALSHVADFLPWSSFDLYRGHESCRRLLTLECFWPLQEPWVVRRLLTFECLWLLKEPLVVSQTSYLGVLLTSPRAMSRVADFLPWSAFDVSKRHASCRRLLTLKRFQLL